MSSRARVGGGTRRVLTTLEITPNTRVSVERKTSVHQLHVVWTDHQLDRFHITTHHIAVLMLAATLSTTYC